MFGEGREPPPSPARSIYAIERPDPKLWTYYVLRALLAGPGFPFLLAYLRFRYRSLRYRFDDEGISMSWGVLFRREIHLTYARIQDIHLTRNVVERQLGLARLEIQTASGSSTAEMTLEGILEVEVVRDFLYARMRGMQDPDSSGKSLPGAPPEASAGEAVRILREAAGEIRRIRELLEAGDTGSPKTS